MYVDLYDGPKSEMVSKPGRGPMRVVTFKAEIDLIERIKALQARYRAEGRLVHMSELWIEGLRRYLDYLERQERGNREGDAPDKE